LTPGLGGVQYFNDDEMERERERESERKKERKKNMQWG